MQGCKVARITFLFILAIDSREAGRGERKTGENGKMGFGFLGLGKNSG